MPNLSRWWITRRFASVLAATIVVAGCLGLAGDFGPAHARLRALHAAAPSLDTELARHVCMDSPTAWLEYCRSVGAGRLRDACGTLYTEMFERSYEDLLRDKRTLMTPLLRIAETLETEFDFVPQAMYTRRNLARSDRDFHAVLQAMRAVAHVSGDRSRSAEARLAMLDSLGAICASLGEPAGVESVHAEAAALELEAGHPERHRARLEAALALSRQVRDANMSCQILGQLAVLHLQQGDVDSMQACYEEGVRLARRHRLPEQVARFALNMARRAAEHGRLALAVDHLAEASEADEPNSMVATRVRQMLRRAGVFADLGCWDQVDRELRLLPVLFREGPWKATQADSLKGAFDADLLRARAAFARGQGSRGEALLRARERDVPAWNRRVGLARLYDAWSEGLQREGRWTAALAVTDRGLAHCDSSHVSEFEVVFLLRRARLLERFGRLAEARACADQLDRRLDRHQDTHDAGWWRAQMVLRARLLLREREYARGRALLREAFAELRRVSARPETNEAARPEDSFDLSIRDAVHELLGLSPAAGYGFEMEWRSLGRRAARPGEGARDPFAAAKGPATGRHFVYHFLSDRLLRWTADARGVSLDTLGLRADACLADVREAVGLLRTEPPRAGEWLGPRSSALLARLATQIMPVHLAASAREPVRLEVSPDGPLLALPFEALLVPTPDGVAPLARVADLSYQLGWGRRSPAASRATVVVSNPDIPEEVRRHHAWAGPLLGSEAESQCARERWPDAVVLRGSRATRSRFLQEAQGASNVYIAAHHVRDPGAPFLGFVPLAAESSSAGSALLEAADIRALDLSPCRLAVLASCASGAPYRVGEQPGPNLGDAFLDAGAHAVVRSFWDVQDQETREFMQRFLARDEAMGDAVLALNAARRAVMAREAGVSPRVWAAWSVATTRDRQGGLLAGH